MKQRLTNMIDEFRSEERARVPDEKLAGMQKALVTGFEVTWDTLDDGSGPGWASNRLAQIADGYVRGATEYGRTGYLSGNPYAREVEVLVRVVFTVDGARKVNLVKSSGSRTYDRLALEQARTIVDGGKVDEAGQAHRRTLWAFITRLEVVPPIPSVGCGLDALLHLDPSRCIYPMKRMPPVSRVELRGTD